MAMNVKITKATRQQCAACILLEGLSGRGKSGTALTLAAALSDSKNFDDTLYVDTENKSINLFDGLTLASGIKVSDLDCVQMDVTDGFAPENYLTCREEARNIGKKIVVFDSITHAWNAKDGILDQVSTLKATTSNALYKKDSYAAWGAPEIVKAKNELFEMVRDKTMHTISTVRLKERMEYDRDENGRSKLVSLGDTQIMQADMKYEFDLVLTCLEQGSTKAGKTQHPKVKVVKSRYAIFVEGETYELTPKVLKDLREYLAEGTDPKVLEEAQRQDYLKLLKERLIKDPTDKTVADLTKENLGFAEVKYSELPFHVLKQVYVTLFK